MMTSETQANIYPSVEQVVLDDKDGDTEPMLRYPRFGHVKEGVNGYSARQGYQEVSEEDNSDNVVR